jgi:aspartyl-tRNA(Asn)/glutamyl-tRNA(Gln) amidotransferase subunit B
MTEYGLPEADAIILIDDKETAAYFEAVASELGAKIDGGESHSELGRMVKLAANYFITEVRKYLGEERGIQTLPITPENYAEFIAIVADGKINSSAAQTVLKEMLKGSDGDSDPSHIIDRLNLVQMSDAGELETIVDTILENNAQSITDFKAGKQNAFQYLIGQVMKETKGKANPQMVSEILKQKLV